ncbi:hypothetical protein P1J78_16415 [Psychromarinibacter sp. C21-152]|uniref:Uncharacterized protein n=1 Tax=Psychromarinibacter sediminicola TaxID=3033385 RepID=A0AAE3NVB3_9RHOB|nr:hypothetical protein [Psychromarinibacter sediminicola]MDF0602324.1 hypothetical protein [Psychromarinibacter sediminicola]
MVRAVTLPVNTWVSAEAMAQEIVGAEVTVVGASYSGDDRASGIHSDGDTVSPGATPGDSGLIVTHGGAQTG